MWFYNLKFDFFFVYGRPLSMFWNRCFRRIGNSADLIWTKLKRNPVFVYSLVLACENHMLVLLFYDTVYFIKISQFYYKTHIIYIINSHKMFYYKHTKVFYYKHTIFNLKWNTRNLFYRIAIRSETSPNPSDCPGEKISILPPNKFPGGVWYICTPVFFIIVCLIILYGSLLKSTMENRFTVNKYYY